MASWRHSPSPILSEKFFSSNPIVLDINRLEILWRSIIKIEPGSDFQLHGSYEGSKAVTSRAYFEYLTSVHLTSVYHQHIDVYMNIDDHQSLKIELPRTTRNISGLMQCQVLRWTFNQGWPSKKFHRDQPFFTGTMLKTFSPKFEDDRGCWTYDRGIPAGMIFHRGGSRRGS